MKPSEAAILLAGRARRLVKQVRHLLIEVGKRAVGGALVLQFRGARRDF